MMTSATTARLFALLAALPCLAPFSHAASIQSGNALASSFASRAIAIDGRFEDWPEVNSSRLAPFSEISGKADPAMARVFSQYPNLIGSAAEIWLAHDHQALYVGMRLSTATPTNNAPNPAEWYSGGDGIILHATDPDGRSFSLLWWGFSPHGEARVSVRTGDAWLELGALQGSAAAQAGAGCDLEITIPWASLGWTGESPARLQLVWEAAFNGIDRDILKALPQEMRIHLGMHSTFNLLTAPSKLASRNYLSRPQWWGTLRFADGEDSPGDTQETLTGTGIAEWNAARSTSPITIDGTLDDWPADRLLSASPSPWAYENRYRTDVGIAWDDDHLYLAFRFHDGEPMFNTEVAQKQMGYRGGDCIQLRLKMGEAVANLCGWYDLQNAIPALTADGKERRQPDLLAVGAAEAFTPLPGGRGYIQEIAIPFSQLLPKTPAVGDSWNATIQLWWAGIDERFSVETAVDFARPAPLRTTYELPRDADVSLGLYDARGKLLRHLVKNEPRSAGLNTESWDGLDQWGTPIPAGSYLLKGIHHDPLRLDYLMSATNPGTPPWWTVDGKGGWLSDQAAPQDVVTDGHTVYIAAPYAEAGHAIIAVGPDGRRIWGINPHVGTPRCISLALMGDRLYAVFSGPELTESVNQYADGDKTAIGRAMLMCFDTRTGELAGPSVKSGAPVRFTTWDYRHDVHNLWDLRLQQRFSPATYGGMHRYSNSGMCETTNALGLAAVGTTLVASMFYDNELLLLDPETVQITGRIPIEAPAGLHGLDDRHLLAVSGTRLVKVAIDTGAISPIVTEGLLAPFGVTTDANGDIYVSDWGASFQVKKYRPDGSFVAAIGKPGGRPWIGDFTPEGMALPRGIAVTGDGRLWVAEDEFSPRRVSVWDAANGTLIRDYIGPANYRGWGLVVDPLNPRRILTCGTEFELNVDEKSYTPLRKLFLRRSREDLFTPDGNGMGAFSKIIHRNGEEFLVLGNRHQLIVTQKRGDEYRPVAAVSGFEAASTIDGTQMKYWDSDLRYHFLPNWYPDFFRGHAGHNYIWNDTSGDTIAQEQEISWLTNTLRRGDLHAPGRIGEWGAAWGLGFGPNWEVYISGFCRDATIIYRLDPEFTPEGLPRYSFDRCTPIVTHLDAGVKVHSLYASSSGKLFVTYYNDVNRDVITDHAIVCYDRDGNQLWSIAGPRDTAPKSIYGCVNAEFSYPHLGSGVVTWVWWHNGRAYLLTDDGLYLAGFLDNDAAIGPTFTRQGGETSSFASQAPDGRLYLINGANSAHHFLEIKGLDTARRFEQELVISEADEAAIASASRDSALAAREQPLLVIQHLAAPPAADSWQLDAEGVLLTTSRKGGRGARIALKTDGRLLYLAARVRDESPMVNQGDNWQIPFLTGDCVDLMLAIDPQADPRRRQAAAGDVRVLFTELRGEPMAVLYRPVSPGASEPVQMLATTIDEVRRLPECEVTIHRDTDGYTLFAQLPLASLGITSLPASLRGDVGIIYSDATGRDRDQRLYYYNAHTAMVADLTTEASLTPDKWGDILITLPDNRLRNPSFEEPLKKKAPPTAGR